MSNGIASPPMTEADRQFLRRAKERWTSNGSFDPSAAALRNIARADGIDVATAAAYIACLSKSTSIDPSNLLNSDDVPIASRDVPRVVVMPGAFHAEYPHTGADGERVLHLAKELKWQAVRVPLPSLAPMAENAERLVAVLSADAERPTIVVSLSKGGADVRAAFSRANAVNEFRNVRAWVSLSGIVTGTPLIGWLRARPLRCAGVRMLLRLRGQRFAVLDELGHRNESTLQRPFALPAGLRAIHVVGFPMQRHLTIPWAHRGHARLAPLGPNDGGGILLADALGLPGELIPVWGADHYMQPAWDIRPLLKNILREAARERAEITCDTVVDRPASDDASVTLHAD